MSSGKTEPLAIRDNTIRGPRDEKQAIGTIAGLKMEYQTQTVNLTHVLPLHENLRHILDFQKLKYCFSCGICTASCPVAELLPEHYNPRTLLHSLPLGDIETLKSAELWLCAWCYRCYNRCPQNLCLPEIFQAVRKFAVKNGYLDGFFKALKIIRENVTLPASSSYVCFHPERAIDNKQMVREAIQKNILDYETRTNKDKANLEGNSQKVAVIGSGPAGLSAARDLVRKGYSVTVFEASSSPGGMLKKCIPEYRLPKKIIDFEIKQLNNLGVKIEKQIVIGKDLEMKDLFSEYHALFLATGASSERRLEIEGEELKGVYHALNFLEKANAGEIKASEKAIIIGGGNVALDCARTALKLGAEEATIIYRRSKDEMPANPLEVKEAEEDGVKIEFLVTPTRIIGKNGKVIAVICARNKLTEADETGRRHPAPIKDSEFKLEADRVIVAIGQFPNINFLPETIEKTGSGTIAVNPFTMETGFPGVFAGGDLIVGAGSLMEAIATGKQAAISIDRYLREKSLKPIQICQREQGKKNENVQT